MLYGQEHVAYSPKLFLFGEIVNDEIVVDLVTDKNVEVQPKNEEIFVEDHPKHEEIYEDHPPKYEGIFEDHPENNGQIPDIVT